MENYLEKADIVEAIREARSEEKSQFGRMMAIKQFDAVLEDDTPVTVLGISVNVEDDILDFIIMKQEPTGGELYVTTAGEVWPADTPSEAADLKLRSATSPTT